MPLPPSPAKALPGDWLAPQARRVWGGCEPLLECARGRGREWTSAVLPGGSHRLLLEESREHVGEAGDVDLCSILLSAQTRELASGLLVWVEGRWIFPPEQGSTLGACGVLSHEA